jgi:hypothetical protein
MGPVRDHRNRATWGKAPDTTKVQLSEFQVSDDGTEVLSCIQGHRPLSYTVSENK